ncbi:sphingosine N-acyltransferase lag1 [Umbelopsis nana]
MVSRTSSRFNRKRSPRRSDDKPFTLKNFTNYLADHQIDVPFKVIAFITLAYLAGVPYFDKFLFIAHQDAVTGLYGKGAWDLMFLFFYINVFTMARAACMQYVLMPLAVAGGVSKKKRTRFAEQMWTVIYYSTSFTVGVHLAYNSPYWFNTSEFWNGYPHIYHTKLFKYYYVIQFSYWLQQIFVLQVEAPRKDYRELVMHHINTLLLISLSYACNFTRIGNAVFVCMDLPDALFALAKSFNYLNFRFVCDLTFFVMLCTWVYTRVYLYGRIICSTATEPDLYVNFKLDPWNGSWFPYFVKYIILGLEIGLYALILFWTVMIFKVLFKVLVGNAANDDRSDDEDGEEESSRQGVVGTTSTIVANNTTPTKRK